MERDKPSLTFYGRFYLSTAFIRRKLDRYAEFLSPRIIAIYITLSRGISSGFDVVLAAAKRLSGGIRQLSQRKKDFMLQAAVVSFFLLPIIFTPYFAAPGAASIKSSVKTESRRDYAMSPSRGAVTSPPAEKTQAASGQPPGSQVPPSNPNPPPPPAAGGDLKNSVGIDYAWVRPGGAAIAGRSYRFVARYLSNDGSKNLSGPELADLKAQGLPVVVIWESTDIRALSGAAGGVADAQAALAQANALGVPASAPIYFAIDFPITPDQYGPVDDYFRGAASILGLGRIGVYGSFYAVNHCFDAGIATFGWQTFSWSDGKVEPRAHIFQDGRLDFGGDADLNVAQQSYIGQW